MASSIAPASTTSRFATSAVTSPIRWTIVKETHKNYLWSKLRRLTFPASATASTSAVEVVNGVERKVEHNHVPGLRDVQPPGSDVRAHHVLGISCSSPVDDKLVRVGYI